MAVEVAVDVPVELSRTLVKRTQRIVINTPRNVSEYMVVGTREQYITESSGLEYPQDSRIVARRLINVFGETVTIGTGETARVTTVAELAEAISTLLDRWAVEDEEAEALSLAQEQAAIAAEQAAEAAAQAQAAAEAAAAAAAAEAANTPEAGSEPEEPIP